ncbi:MAG: hypothetical protein Q8900_03415 [Bacillota bacterium]|nr:hypothetical protein [Bacillota bacterium]
MGTIETNFQCNECKYKFTTSGLYGFRNDRDKGIVKFSLSLRHNEVKNGVDGISAILYCKNCDKVVNLILLEYKTTVYKFDNLYNCSVDLKPGYTYENFKKIMNDNSRGFYKYGQCWTLTEKMSAALEKEKKQVCPKVIIL